jgi:uncharacterized protein YecT (DUF1311 family)
VKSPLMILLFLGCAATAQAQSVHLEAYDRCVEDNGPINNSVVHECAGAASDAAKADINRYYKKAQANLATQNSQDAIALENSQKAWVIYRNSHCALAEQHIGSPMASYCPMQLNAARAEELKALAGE